jgi:hypothetical protein
VKFFSGIAISTVQERELDDALAALAKSPVDVFYIVDSYGALYSEQVHDLVGGAIAALEGTGKQVGFHAHNNMQLAYANTIEALIVGASRLDVTIAGLGRGVHPEVEDGGVVPVLDVRMGEDGPGDPVGPELADETVQNPFPSRHFSVDMGHEGEVRDIQEMDVRGIDAKGSVSGEGLPAPGPDDGPLLGGRRVSSVAFAEDEDVRMSPRPEDGPDEVPRAQDRVVVVGRKESHGLAPLPAGEEDVDRAALSPRPEIDEFHQKTLSGFLSFLRRASSSSPVRPSIRTRT